MASVIENVVDPDIVLLGHLIRHVMLVPDEHGERYTGHIREAFEPLIPEMIKESLKETGKGVKCPEPRVIPCFETLIQEGVRALSGFGELHSTLDSFPPGSTKAKQNPRVLRVKSEQLAANIEIPSRPDSTGKSKNFSYMEWLVEQIENDAAEESVSENRILLFYDHNPYFRDLLKSWAGEDKNKERLQREAAKCGGGVILAINDILTAEWIDLICDMIFPDGARERSYKNAIAVMSADALRKGGLRIMELGALETSINDFVAQLESGSLKTICECCRHLVVVFRETGALYIDLHKESGSVTFAPNSDRHAQTHPGTYGSMPGKFTTMVTSIVREMVWAMSTGKKRSKWDIDGALRMGVAAFNHLYDRGFAKSDSGARFSPSNDLKRVLSPERRTSAISATLDQKEPEFLLTTVQFSLNRAKKRNWKRTDDYFRVRESLEGFDDKKLINIVRKGVEEKLRKKVSSKSEDRPNVKPKAMIWIPYSFFGGLKLIDYDEIERFNSLAKLIDKYLETPTWKTPMSIAVFGEPGSGKSFSVKQILQRVSPDRKSEPLTFNMAQFSSIEQLTEAFHKVQDKALASAEVPLVIFDEFDATVDGDPLGWLKYFLAPMQDGIFMGKSEDYRVGRSIFLFSGGTSDTYREFGADMAPERAKAAKLPDFISRLRGYLDVKGINPPRVEGKLSLDLPVDLLLRRAVLLRSMLEAHAAPILRTSGKGYKVAHIDPEVVRAFLYAPRYKHGVRSMEALIQMSRFIDGQFVPASLPTIQLLNMHVHPKSFLDIAGWPSDDSDAQELQTS